MDMDYQQELILKEAGVRDLLAPFSMGAWEGILAAPNPLGYRNKMELAFGDEYRDGPLALGIRKKRSLYEVAIPTQCALINDDFKAILQYVLQACRQSGETFFHKKRHTGTLRHLVLRRGEFTGEVLVNLVTTSQSRVDMDALAAGIKAVCPRVTGVLHTLNDGVADVVKNQHVRVVYGRDFYTEKIMGLSFRVGAFSFFQTNSSGAEVLYGKVKEYAGHGEAAYDLYCGTGTIAQVLASQFETVVGVELDEQAIQAAAQNAQANAIPHCRFVAGDVLKIADTLDQAPQVIVVDPPRDGLHPKALPKLASLNAQRWVYVACKPASLARDAQILLRHGYRPRKAVCVDMFPRTTHVECVCLFTKKE